MLEKLVLLSAGLALICVCHAAEFPAPVSKCHFNDEQCLIEQAHKLFKAAENGIPELGIQPLEPLIVDHVEVLGDQNSPANINLIATDLKFYNFSKGVVKTIKGLTRDASKPMKIEYVARNPQATIKSKYKINGKILILPIRGEGDMTLVLKGITSRVRAFIEPEKRDGKTYLNVKDAKIDSKMESAIIDLTNLFNGDKALSENVIKVINDNWRLLSQEISPKVDQMIALGLKDSLGKLFGSVPYEEFYLPDE